MKLTSWKERAGLGVVTLQYTAVTLRLHLGLTFIAKENKLGNVQLFHRQYNLFKTVYKIKLNNKLAMFGYQ